MATKRCPSGHEMTPENTYSHPNWAPRCRECKKASHDRAVAAKHAAGLTSKGKPPAKRVLRCKNGHEKTEKATYFLFEKGRLTKHCRPCRNAASRRLREKNLERGRVLPLPKYCKVGHPMTTRNCYVQPDGRVRCRACRWGDRRAVAEAALFRKVAAKESCINGHLRTVQGTQVRKNGTIACKPCINACRHAKIAAGDYGMNKCGYPTGCDKKVYGSKLKPNWRCKSHRRDTTVTDRPLIELLVSV